MAAPSEKGSITAVEMRIGFGEKPEELSSPLQDFFNRMFQVEIFNLESEVKDLSPATIALFKAIEEQLAGAQEVLIEKLTAEKNLDAFTAGTEDGIAKNMPIDLVPLVIAALSKITAISHRAQQDYEQMTNQLPTMLIQLKKLLIRQAVIAHDEEIRELEHQQAILEASQPDIATATAELEHDAVQQQKIISQTAWLKTTIGDIKNEIKAKKRSLQLFFEKNNFLEFGARQLSQPI